MQEVITPTPVAPAESTGDKGSKQSFIHFFFKSLNEDYNRRIRQQAENMSREQGPEATPTARPTPTPKHEAMPTPTPTPTPKPRKSSRDPQNIEYWHCIAPNCKHPKYAFASKRKEDHRLKCHKDIDPVLFHTEKVVSCTIATGSCQHCDTTGCK